MKLPALLHLHHIFFHWNLFMSVICWAQDIPKTVCYVCMYACAYLLDITQFKLGRTFILFRYGGWSERDRAWSCSIFFSLSLSLFYSIALCKELKLLRNMVSYRVLCLVCVSVDFVAGAVAHRYIFHCLHASACVSRKPSFNCDVHPCYFPSYILNDIITHLHVKNNTSGFLVFSMSRMVSSLYHSMTSL